MATTVRACVCTLEMWLEWIRDELPLVSIPEASTELRQLFERATKDYLCECPVECRVLNNVVLIMEEF